MEALRGVAIITVVAYHVDRHVVWPPSWAGTWLPLPLAYLRAGHTGVSLFFVLSGFLLASPFLDADGGRQVPVWEYFRRRALRVLPLYWTAVGVGTLLSAATPIDLLRGLPYLVFANAAYGWFTPMEPYSTVWWSLATEVEFYLVLPVLALGLRSGPRRWLGAFALALYGLAYGAFLTGWLRMGSIGGQVHLIVSAIGFGPVFLCGIAAAAWYRRWGTAMSERLAASAWARNGGADLALIGVALALGWLLRWVAFHGWEWTSAPPRTAWHLPEGVLWALVLLLLLVAPCRLRSIARTRVLGMAGVLSYSIYLVHYPVLVLSLGAVRARWPAAMLHGWTAPALGVAAAIALATLALSAVAYRSIERPFLARKARVGSRQASSARAR